MSAALRIAALAALVATLGLPWEAWIGGFPAHMLRHAALVALVPPLVVLAFPSVAGALAVPPLVGAAVEAVVSWGWHLPALHHWAQDGVAAATLEQASFLAAGLLVWAGALRADSPLAGAAGLLVTSMHMTLLGALLILAARPLYGGHADLAAQQVGGIVMLALVTPAYLVGGLVLVRRALGGERTA